MNRRCKNTKTAACRSVITAFWIFVLSASVCFAEVITTTEESGPADFVYAAGNPDLYPLEYYDAEEKCYKGVMPELLSKVSENTGLSFVYVNAGEKDTRLELARNSQVDMVTVFKKGDFSDNAVPVQLPVLTAAIDGREQEICIGFTQITSDGLRKEIVDALKSIPDSEKLNMALSHSLNHKPDKNNTHWIFIVIAAVLASAGTAAVILFFKKKKIAKTKATAMTDELTGLGNGKYYFYSFESFIPEQIRDLYYVAFISFSEAKKKNLLNAEEILEIQKYAGQQLNAVAGSTEYLSSIGDGTFAFVYQSGSKEDAERRMKEALHSVNEYLAGFQKEYAQLFAAGICSLAENPDCNAEFSLASAKQGYLQAVRQKLPYAFCEKGIIGKNIADEELKQSVGKAFENKEFKLYLQFIVDRIGEKICGAEVLSRWDNPQRGLMKPEKYIEMLKNTGAITNHDYYIFENVCSRLESWKDTDCGNLFLNCNFTRVSVSEKGFADKIKEISDRYEFDHGKLVLEVTEDSLFEDGETASYNIERCRKMGFKIAIDDIGGGFSSISDLYGSEIDLVKVERKIVVSGVNEKGFKLLNSIISLAHNMDAKVLCEGVETEEQRKMILETDCDYIQGYCYSHVLPYDEAMKFLNKVNGRR